MASVKKSFAWSAVEQIGPRVLQMALGVVLARLLEPAEFGLVGMLALFIAIAQVFADCGLSASLIQRKELTADDETSVCAMNVIAGVLLAGLLCLLSPLVARFYEQPVLMPMLCVQSLTIVFSSLCVVQAALLTRAMQFKQTALISTACTLGSGLVGVGLAWLGWGVWSLVWSMVVASALRLILLWSMSHWRPRGQVSFERVRAMWSFSSYLLYCQLIGITMQNLYPLLIGKLYSPTSLGYFDRANNLRLLPVGTISQIVNRVSFPLLSQCHDDKVLLRRRIREIVRSVLMLSAGGLTLLALLADPLVPMLLSEKWRPAIPLLQIMCFASVIYPISGLFLIALQAQGLSRLNFRLETIKTLIALLALALVCQHGVEAMVWSMVALSIINYFFNAWYNVKLLEYRWSSQAWDILPTLGLCAVAGGTAWWLSSLLPSVDWLLLAVRAGLFAVFCATAIYCFRHSYFEDVWKHLTWAGTRLRQQASPQPA